MLPSDRGIEVNMRDAIKTAPSISSFIDHL